MLVAQGLRKSLACPAPSTLDRRIASWLGFHRMKNLASPFDAPQVKQARSKARCAAARPPAPKSQHPITRDILEQLLETKTTAKGETPRLVLKGRAAQALVHWIEVGQIADGPLFRPISMADRVLARRLSPDAIYQITRHRLKLAGLPEGFASPHGLRSGFLTQAALDGVPIQAAMRLSLHRSMAQAQQYYDDVDIAENPASDLLDKS